jgi:hypothetical protein
VCRENRTMLHPQRQGNVQVNYGGIERHFSRFRIDQRRIVDAAFFGRGSVTMAFTAQRRSERVLLDVAVVVRGESRNRTFQEETFTVTVSAHGALLMLEADVSLGQTLMVMNPKNWDEREARVAYKGPVHAGLAQVAVEFAKPAPDFWQMDSPPVNWQTGPQ